jgi:hypothetical protein
MRWTPTQLRLLSVLDLRTGPLPTPVNQVLKAFFGARLDRLSARRRARLLERLRALRYRMNRKLKAAASSCRIRSSEDHALYVDIPVTDVPAARSSSAPTCGGKWYLTSRQWRQELQWSGIRPRHCFGASACAEFIREALADGPLPVHDLETWCRRDGFSHATYRRGCSQAGVHKHHEPTFQGGWLAALSEAPPGRYFVTAPLN